MFMEARRADEPRRFGTIVGAIGGAALGLGFGGDYLANSLPHATNLLVFTGDVALSAGMTGLGWVLGGLAGGRLEQWIREQLS